MKHSTNVFIILLGAMLALSACKDSIELNDVDTTVTADLGLALPIGNITATMGDILSMGKIPDYTLIDKDGIIHFHDTFNISPGVFRTINVEKYPADTIKHCNVYDGFGVAEIWPGDHYEVVYPIQVDFDGVNDKLPSDPDYERFDSVYVLQAQYISTITLDEELAATGAFQWSWIKRIDVLLRDGFVRAGGETITVYDVKDPEKQTVSDFGQPIELNIDNFLLCFLKDPKKPAEPSNMLQGANLAVKFYVDIPWDSPKIPILPTYNIDYNLHLQMLEFSALWGAANPSKDMRDQDTILLEKEWEAWKTLKKAKLPLAKPSVSLTASSEVAGKFKVKTDGIFVVSDDAPLDTAWATFDGKREKTFIIPNDDEMIDIHSYANIGQKWSHSLLFNYEEDKGRFDRLFMKRPDRVGYNYEIEMYDLENYAEIRLVPNSRIYLDAIVDMPFVLNKGMEFQYSDTIKDVNLSQFSLDSILNGALAGDNVQNANVVVYLALENRLPLGLAANLHFLDENGKEVKTVDGKPLRMIKLGSDPTVASYDSIHLKMPALERMANTNAYVAQLKQEPEKYIIDIDKENFNALTKTKNIVFYVSTNNEGASETQYPVAIVKESALKAHVGVTARINGKVDLNKLLKGEKK